MIIRCNVCNVIVADVKPGSQIRKGSAMLCKNCLAELNSTINASKTQNVEMPEFFRRVFG